MEVGLGSFHDHFFSDLLSQTRRRVGSMWLRSCRDLPLRRCQHLYLQGIQEKAGSVLLEHGDWHLGLPFDRRWVYPQILRPRLASPLDSVYSAGYDWVDHVRSCAATRAVFETSSCESESQAPKMDPDHDHNCVHCDNHSILGLGLASLEHSESTSFRHLFSKGSNTRSLHSVRLHLR